MPFHRRRWWGGVLTCLGSPLADVLGATGGLHRDLIAKAVAAARSLCAHNCDGRSLVPATTVVAITAAAVVAHAVAAAVVVAVVVADLQALDLWNTAYPHL